MTQINAFTAPLLLERIYLCEDPFSADATALLSAKAEDQSNEAKVGQKPEEEFLLRRPKMANKWLQTAATIAALAAAEERIQCFFSATRRIKSEFIGQFASLGDLLDFKESILDNPHKFTDEVPELSASVPLGEQLSFLLRQSHLLLVNDLCAAVELFKGMPAAALLQKQDMVNLTSTLGMALVGFCERYHSSRWESPVVVKLSNGFSPMLFANELPQESKLHSMADLLFRRTMWRFNALKLSSEEFLLLRAIVMSHSALDGLSPQALGILQRESERYAGVLLHHLQTRLGQMGGVERFAALLSLVECVLRTGPLHRRYHAKMDAHLEDAQMSRTMPRCLLPICMGEGDQTQEVVVHDGM